MPRATALFAFLLSLAAPLMPEEPPTCPDDQPLTRCYTLFASPSTQREKETVASLKEEMKSEVVGEGRALTTEAAEERATTTETPGTGTSVLSFLARYFAAAGVEGFDETKDNYSFARVFEVGEALRVDIGAVIFRKPEVFEALRAAMPAEIREQVVADLEDGIQDFDKADLNFLASWEKGSGEFRFGRDPDDYLDLTTPWLEARHAELVDVVPMVDWVLTGEGDAAEARFGEDFLTKSPGDLKALPGVTNEEVEAVERSLIDAATGMGALRLRAERAMADLASQASQMITNQPQILLGGTYHKRDHFTGPSEWSARFEYEVGLSGNVNDFVSWAEKKARSEPAVCPPATAPSYSLACLRAYLESRSALGFKESTMTDRGNRLAIRAEYTDTDPLRYTLPNDAFPDATADFSLDRTQKWTGSLTYGTYLTQVRLPNLLGALGGGPSVVPVDTTRFDLEAKYDDVTGDPMRQSRFTATATLSQKMSENTVFSVAAVWANKAEYLGEVDQELSAHFGLRWQVDPKKP